jgi:hypothetical protein
MDPDATSDQINGTFTSFFEDKKSLRSYKTAEIEDFLTIFA